MSRENQPSAPSDPERRVGRMFRRFEGIPEKRRLEYYAPQYEGDEAWDDYVEHKAAERGGIAESTRRKRYGIARERLAEVCAERGRHYAVARPDDVEAFFRIEAHLSDHVLRDRRFMPVYGFYEHLLNHVDHHHAYNPVLLAALEEGSETRRLWDIKEQHNDERAETRDKR